MSASESAPVSVSSDNHDVRPATTAESVPPEQAAAVQAALSQSIVSSRVLNVPNSLSMARLILAIFVGVLIELGQYTPAWIVFIIAASTDFVDGWWARRFQQITKLGRILDPFVDKIIITAAMVALVGVPGSGVAAWMATVIVGRELLVTSLRGMIEGSGGDFSARWMGKWKMLFQCVAVVACLILVGQASPPAWLNWFAKVSLWLAVVLTIASGVDYVAQAVSLSKRATQQAG
jgi:CDP-diacylglycerol--glycerol-3-phosphate 3-phosphatidyltransferase